MKRFSLILGLCVFISLGANSAELTVSASNAGNSTDEINSSFSQSKDTKWFIHRIKPTDKNKTQQKVKKIKIPEFDETEYVIIHPNKETKDSQSDKQVVQQAEKKVEKQNVKQESTSAQTVENKKSESVQDKPAQKQKETVHTTQPAQKVISNEEKEDKTKLKQEEEKKRYRELEELTEQYQQAVALYTDNNLDASLESFSKIPEDKRPPEAYLLMGNILMDKGKKDDAVFMYGRAILTDPTYYKAYYNLGNVYLSDDKFNMAIEQFKMAGKHNPNNPYIYYNLGCAYIKAGELKKAKSAFIKALELKNSVPEFHYNLAFVYKKLGKEKLAKTYLSNYNKLTGQVD